MYVIFGANGRTGGETARALIERGEGVRVVVRRRVEPTWVPPEQRHAMLAETGLSPEVVDALLGMYDGIASGRVGGQDGNAHWRGTTSLTAAVERLAAGLHGAADSASA